MCNYALVAHKHRDCGHMSTALVERCYWRRVAYSPDREPLAIDACDHLTRLTPVIVDIRCYRCRHPQIEEVAVGLRPDEDYSDPEKRKKLNRIALVVLEKREAREARDKKEKEWREAKEREERERLREEESRRKAREQMPQRPRPALVRANSRDFGLEEQETQDDRSRSRSRSRGRGAKRDGLKVVTGRWVRSQSEKNRKSRSPMAPGSEEVNVPGPDHWITDEWKEWGWKIEVMMYRTLAKKVPEEMRPHRYLLPYGCRFQTRLRSLKYVELFKKDPKEWEDLFGPREGVKLEEKENEDEKGDEPEDKGEGRTEEKVEAEVKDKLEDLKLDDEAGVVEATYA